MAGDPFQIFVSYRREDSPAHAGRLYDRLAAQFGEENVFLDVDAIGPGRDFRKVIEERLDACDVFIAVIGRDWLDVADEQGTRRLDRGNDYVRLEIEAALRRGDDVVVIPALVEGATVPSPERLPEGLADLSYRNAVEIRDASFHADAKRLIDALEAIQRERAERRRRAAEDAARRAEAEAEAQAAEEEEEEEERRRAEAAARAAEEEARRREAAEAAARAAEEEEEEEEERRRAEAAARAAEEEQRRRQAEAAALAAAAQATPPVQTMPPDVPPPVAAPPPLHEPLQREPGWAVRLRSIPRRWLAVGLGGAAVVTAIVVSLIVLGGGGSPEGEGSGGTAGGTTADLPAATPIASPNCGDVVYEGPESPQVIIASDLPLQGPSGAQARELAKAVETVLRTLDFHADLKAGSVRVGFQSCDDSTAQAGTWDSATCAANARAYAANASVIGVVGAFNSGCTKVELPLVNAAEDGPIPMVSPANVDVGLTRPGPGTQSGEPGKYYPTGTRNYARMLGADDVQGAAGALVFKRLGAQPVFVLHDGEAYGIAVAQGFRAAAGRAGVGVPVAGFAAWNPNGASYDKMVAKIRSSGARGVYLAGLVDSNGGRLVKDLRAGLGSGVPIVASDGFMPASYLVEKAGAAAQGMYLTTAGVPIEELPPKGRRFAAKLGGAADPFAVYGAQAAVVLLNAMAASDGTRSSIVDALLPMTLDDTLVGPLKLDPNGDPSPAPFAVYRVKGSDAVLFTVVKPTTKLATGG